MNNEYTRKKINIVRINDKEYILLRDLKKDIQYRNKVLFYAWVDRSKLNSYIHIWNKIKKETI